MSDTATAPVARRVRIKPYDIEAGPLGHLQAERERLAGLTWQHFDAVPLGATIGGELSGLDLAAELSDTVIAEIRQALLDYKVIFFRDQHLTAAQHVAFARRFGELEEHPFLKNNEELPELVRFEKTPEVGGYENGWHSDVTWRLEPSMGSILRAEEVPASGGDTLFADMYAAYEGLDDATRAGIDGLIAIHDYSQVFGDFIPEDKKAEMREKYPLVEHPVVRTHPETGRKLLYLNRFFGRSIVGLPETRATPSSTASAVAPRSSSTSAASAGLPGRSPSGTTAPSSTTPAATTGPPAGSWSEPPSSATARTEAS